MRGFAHYLPLPASAVTEEVDRQEHANVRGNKAAGSCDLIWAEACPWKKSNRSLLCHFVTRLQLQ